jgi:hypothetical protein
MQGKLLQAGCTSHRVRHRIRQQGFLNAEKIKGAEVREGCQVVQGRPLQQPLPNDYGQLLLGLSILLQSTHRAALVITQLSVVSNDVLLRVLDSCIPVGVTEGDVAHPARVPLQEGLQVITTTAPSFEPQGYLAR